MSDLGADLAAALDASRFMHSCGMTPDPWQAELLSGRPQRALLLCCRQAGKSTVTAVAALHEALYRPGALILLLSPSQRQSAELLAKARGLLGAVSPRPVIEAESVLSLTFGNGSRIVSLPGKQDTVRGYSAVDLLVIDEAAWVADDLYRAVRPMLAVSGGRLLGLSTPFGRRGWFYTEWTGDADWARYSITADRCPRISPEFLAEERQALGEWQFRQEYGCEFVDNTSSAFPTALVDQMRVTTPSSPLLWGGGNPFEETS